MNSIPMLENIHAQPGSLRGLLALQQGSQHATLQACAGKIRKATGNIIFSGMGGSLFATLPAVSRLSQEGSSARSIESAELLHYGKASLRAGDVGVVISGMTVIGVTNVAESKLEQIADITLMIGSGADKLIAVQSYTGTVLTLLLLAEEVLAAESSRLSEACSAALPLLSAHIDACLRQSDHWKDLLMGGPLYLLGRGPALGAVYEGALLLHETAKTAAVGMSSGQFRHGPAEILSGDFRAVVFGTPPPTQALDRMLANDLFSAGANVRWIGPAPEAGTNHDGAPSLIAWPEIPPLLAPLFEIVPIQVAAYRLALWRGITPGDFRFVSEVTATESGFLSSASSHA